MFRSEVRIGTAALVCVVSFGSGLFTHDTVAADQPANVPAPQVERCPRSQSLEGRRVQLSRKAEDELINQFLNQIVGLPNEPPGKSQGDVNTGKGTGVEKTKLQIAARNNQITIRTVLHGATLECVADRATFAVADMKGQISAVRNRLVFQYVGRGTTGDGGAEKATYDDATGLLTLDGNVILNRRNGKDVTMSTEAARIQYCPIMGAHKSSEK
jgi:hypothetical protein